MIPTKLSACSEFEWYAPSFVVVFLANCLFSRFVFRIYLGPIGAQLKYMNFHCFSDFPYFFAVRPTQYRGWPDMFHIYIDFPSYCNHISCIDPLFFLSTSSIYPSNNVYISFRFPS